MTVCPLGTQLEALLQCFQYFWLVRRVNLGGSCWPGHEDQSMPEQDVMKVGWIAVPR